jgi:predicted RNase H-like HicB family nuclease
MPIVAIIHKSRKTFGVSFPDLPGCIAAGGTVQDALENAASAVAAHLALMVEQGETIPTPSTLDALKNDPEYHDDFAAHVAVALVAYEPPSKAVRVNITIDEHLLHALDRAAERANTTRSGFIAAAVRDHLRG